MSNLARRRFDQLATELSVALGVAVPRHALWLATAGQLESAKDAAAFCDEPLDAYLAAARLPALRGQARLRLRRAVARFDPARPTPEEIIGALFGGGSRV
jgi:hypothetical protein